MIKPILFILLLAIFWVPLLQELTHYFKEPELKGAFVKPTKPNISIESFKSFQFQKQFEEYQNYNFGFRGLLVKIKNTVEYLLFKEISVSDQIEGKDGFIFSHGSVERTVGHFYNGKNQNDSTISKIAFLKERVEKRGGHFLAVIAPSKEIVVPEKLPASYNSVVIGDNDYKDFVQGYKKYNIPFIDFCSYFKKIKTLSSYPLITKTGFHWSVYGASIAHDSIVKYVQHSLSKPIPSYIRTGIELSDTAKESDADFEGPMNLLFSLQEPHYYYPKLDMIPSSLNNYRPKVIILGDSFFWQIKDLRKLQYIFSEDSRYWYYFSESFPLSDLAGGSIKDIDVIEELETADFVILIGSTGTLDRFPFGVTDYYYDNIKKYEISKIEDSKKGSYKNPPVMNAINLGKEVIQIHIKAANDKYVCLDTSSNAMRANSDNPWQWETFSLIALPEKNQFALQAYTKRYLCAELDKEGIVNANRDYIGKWETFLMIKFANDIVAFQAANGKYLSLDEKSFQLFAKSDTIGNYEKFKMTIN